MDEETISKIQVHLDALVEILRPIGFEFNLSTAEFNDDDEPVAEWGFSIKREEQS